MDTTLPAGLTSIRPRQHSAADPIGLRPLEVVLVNNASAAAFARVSFQFRALFEGHEHGHPRRVRVRTAVLSAVPCTSGGAATCPSVWRLLDETPVDAIVVTGAEPTVSDLRDEACWPALSILFATAERRGLPMLLSCFAAHAAVFHAEGISRRRLQRKCFGVFREARHGADPLLDGLPDSILVPHSRWNEVSEDALAARGYAILTRSDATGAGAFVGRDRGSWLHLQGHLEYDRGTLAGELARDRSRFERGELAAAPLPPVHATEADDIAASRSATCDPRPLWRLAADALIGNWLNEAVRAAAGGASDHDRVVCTI